LEACPVSSTHEPTSVRSSIGGSRSIGGSSIVRGSITSMKQSIAQGWSQMAKNDPIKEQFIKEIRMLTQLQEHRNIVGVMGAVTHGTSEPQLVLEYMERGSLYDFLKSDAPIGGQLILKILKDVAAGVMFLHNADPQIVHSDLKSSNILVDETFRAKVSDFGWGAAGTPYWTAPEVLRREAPYTVQSDVYAFGVTMYEIYARTFPYQGEDPATVLKQLRDRSVKKRPATPSTMSSAVKNMMRDCLTSKPHKRPTMEELVARIERLTVEDVEYQVNKTASSEIFFPANVAKELGKGHTVETQTHENVSVVYCEIVGFGALASELPPLKVANLLQRFNDRFDGLAEHHHVFKVEMMGAGAWLGATNCVQHQPNDHVTKCARIAIDTVKHAGSILLDEDDISKGFLQVQTAFVTGQVHGKVVGSRSPRYSLSGPAVEAAQCLASEKCEPGRILCTEAEQTVLKDKAPDIVLEMKSRIFVAGLGAQFTFWVNTSEYARPK
jgi:class 3 adenylate cyclase